MGIRMTSEFKRMVEERRLLLARVSRNLIMREAGVAEAEPSAVEGQAYITVHICKYTWEQRPYPSRTRSTTC